MPRPNLPNISSLNRHSHSSLRGSVAPSLPPNRLNLGVRFSPTKRGVYKSAKNLTKTKHRTYKNSQGEFSGEIQPECPTEYKPIFTLLRRAAPILCFDVLTCWRAVYPLRREFSRTLRRAVYPPRRVASSLRRLPFRWRLSRPHPVFPYNPAKPVRGLSLPACERAGGSVAGAPLIDGTRRHPTGIDDTLGISRGA
jgi:hypothetical protein